VIAICIQTLSLNGKTDGADTTPKTVSELQKCSQYCPAQMPLQVAKEVTYDNNFLFKCEQMTPFGHNAEPFAPP